MAAPKAEPARSHLLEISNPDPNKSFNLDKALAHRNVPGTFQGSKSAASKEFYFQQKFSPKGYETRDFGGKKESWFASLKFWAKDASLKGRYEIPNATTAAAVKTAPTKDARESSKTAATRELADAHRPYLGKEAEKLNKILDPNKLPRFTRGRNTLEVDEELQLHELKTVEDVKALLNKN